MNDNTQYKLSMVQAAMYGSLDRIRRNKVLGYSVESEVKRLEKFLIAEGGSKCTKYVDPVKNLEETARNVINRLNMDLNGCLFDNPEYLSRLDRLETFFQDPGTNSQGEPDNIDDARTLIKNTTDPNIIMEIISTQPIEDRTTLIMENAKILSDYIG